MDVIRELEEYGIKVKVRIRWQMRKIYGGRIGLNCVVLGKSTV